MIPAALPPAATILAAADQAPVVISARRGAGAVVFSGALDAWRQRGDEYGHFWRGLLVAQAADVPPALEVSADPAVAVPGEWTTISVRLRDVPDGDVIAFPPVMARVVSPGARSDDAVRVWPTAEPGVYRGGWRGRAAGRYNVTVTAGDLRGDAIVTLDAAASHGSQADPHALELAASATGGRMFPAGEVPALVRAMTEAHPRQRVTRQAHPMRSPWWMVPFAALLSAEWAVRRTRGLP